VRSVPVTSDDGSIFGTKSSEADMSGLVTAGLVKS